MIGDAHNSAYLQRKIQYKLKTCSSKYVENVTVPDGSVGDSPFIVNIFNKVSSPVFLASKNGGKKNKIKKHQIIVFNGCT